MGFSRPGSAAGPACLSCGLSGRFICIYLDMPGMCLILCVLWLFWMSEIVLHSALRNVCEGTQATYQPFMRSCAH